MCPFPRFYRRIVTMGVGMAFLTSTARQPVARSNLQRCREPPPSTAPTPDRVEAPPPETPRAGGMPCRAHVNRLLRRLLQRIAFRRIVRRPPAQHWLACGQRLVEPPPRCELRRSLEGVDRVAAPGALGERAQGADEEVEILLRLALG